MFLFFHEKISLLTVFCILMALSGIGMLYDRPEVSKRPLSISVSFMRFIRTGSPHCANCSQYMDSSLSTDVLVTVYDNSVPMPTS